MKRSCVPHWFPDKTQGEVHFRPSTGIFHHSLSANMGNLTNAWFTHSSKLMVKHLKTCRFFIASLSSNIYCKWFGHPFFDWKFPPFRTVVGGLSWHLFGQSGLLSWVFVPRNGKGSVAKANWFPPFLELRPWPTTVWCTKHRGRMDVHQETKIEHYWNVLNILHGIDVWSSLCISQSSTAPRIAFQWRC